MRRVRRRTVRRRPCKACIAALAHGNDRQQRPSLGRPSLLKVCRRLGCIICPDLLQGGTEQGGVMWKGQQNASASDSPPRSHPAPHWQAALSRRGRGKLGVPVLPSSNAWPGHKGRQQPKHHPVTCLHHNQPPAVACGEHLLAVGHHLQGSRQGWPCSIKEGLHYGPLLSACLGLLSASQHAPMLATHCCTPEAFAGRARDAAVPADTSLANQPHKDSVRRHLPCPPGGDTCTTPASSSAGWRGASSQPN